ncbi:hypothetical protein [Sutcliffiella deserti]|uniref:hypothetical protein n=1 Tax=Sutcliffiella deserti TaxID=2875501 RepID=UPI001CC15EE8|nr:hypothetical protein [Sutcliffiella deserti]
MLWIFISVLVVLLIVFFHDHFLQRKSSKDKPLPLNGLLVSGALFYLLSNGFITEEEGNVLEQKSLDEIENYILDKKILTKQEWVDLCLTKTNSVALEEVGKDIPYM